METEEPISSFGAEETKLVLSFKSNIRSKLDRNFEDDDIIFPEHDEQDLLESNFWDEVTFSPIYKDPKDTYGSTPYLPSTEIDYFGNYYTSNFLII